MSLYQTVANAARVLAAAPPKDSPIKGVFTEIDVVNCAQQMSGADWGSDQARFRSVLRNANNIMGTMFRERKLARYGPVTLPDGTLDYARIASKIICADAQNGPKKIKTPNGEFPRMMFEDDPITKQGRRIGTTRDDSRKWADQDIIVKKVEKNPQRVKAQADLKAAHATIDELREELTRARKKLTDHSIVSREEFDTLFEMVSEVDARVKVLEAREKVYAA